MYSNHWQRWLQWCNANGVAPLSPSAIQLANHLAFLAKNVRLSASTLRVRRTVVTRTLAQIGCKLNASSSIVSDVIRGAALESASRPNRTPAWDLFMVLEFLRGPPFEPLSEASLLDLTYKTVFLVSLASGRRASEVAALSGLDADVGIENDGSIVLQFLPEFLAKNQRPSDPSPAVLIKSLSEIVSTREPDFLNCPCRALREYRRRTAAIRKPTQRALFLSVSPKWKKDISKSTLARWLVSTIKRAYTSLPGERKGGGVLPLRAARAHETRAWAASLALKHSMSVQAVLSAAYWRSADVFIEHYLRDVSQLRADGTRALAMVMTGQVIMS